ncbi:MAG: carbohydrate-binding family 9-like protein [Candidatus Acidiferrum sp.]
MKKTALIGVALALLLASPGKSSCQGAASEPPQSAVKAAATHYPCSDSDIAHYTARRATGPIRVDGLLDELDWQKAEKSPRFVDMATGEPAIYGTRAAVLWDDQNLYVGFWIEEPFVQAKLTEKNSLIFNENDAEVFIDGGDTYYEFETNARGTTYQMFYIWRDAYKKGGRFDVPEFDIVKNNAMTFGGDYDRQAPTFWKGTNPRGLRWVYFGRGFPGLQSATHVDGTLNDNSDIDKGWTVELAFPWKDAKWLAGDRPLPPKEGDTWKIFFGRFELLHVAGAEVQPHPGWAWNRHGVYDTHLPQCWTAVHFSTRPVQ